VLTVEEGLLEQESSEMTPKRLNRCHTRHSQGQPQKSGLGGIF